MGARLHPAARSTRSMAAACFLVATTLLLSRPLVAAPGNDPAAPVIRLHTGIVATAAAGWPPEPQIIAQLLRDSFDLPGISWTVLGAAAATATQAQRDRLATLLGEGMLQQVLRRRPDPADRFDIMETRSIGPDEWLVLTRVMPAGKVATTWGWLVRDRPDGPRIADVIRDGVSAVITRRHDIEAALRTGDLDAVIAELGRRAGAEVN